MLLKETLQKLAAAPPTDLPFVSAYVDLSPELDAGTRSFGGGNADAPLRSWHRKEEAERGHVRPGVTRLRDLLSEKDNLFDVRGPERDSWDKDRAAILRFLEHGEFDPSTQGVAVFACAGEDFWEVIELGVPLETRLAIDRTPLLYPLARLDDEVERFALCIADSQTARVYVVALGRVEQEESVGGPTINYKMTGGLSQQRIQERITNAVSNHVRDVARRLEEIVFGEDIGRIVLGGDEIMLTEFKNHLSERAWERVVTMDRLDIRLPADQAVARALEAVTTVEQDEARDIARFTLQDTLADGLGVAGERAVKSALEQGAVDTLVVDPDFGTEERREALTELALQMGGRVEFVQNSQEIARMSGVAARLRWRPDGLPSSPVADETTAKQEAAAVA
jgi:hypothetical protein